MLYITTVDQN